MTSYEEKQKSYVDYLRDRQKKKGLVPESIINDASDEDILDSYRMNACSQEPFYTKEQEKQAIMEFDNNESIFNALMKI